MALRLFTQQTHAPTRYSLQDNVIVCTSANASPLQNTSNAQSQGLPPPHPLQHPRQAGLIQQHRPNSPHQSQTLQSTSQGPYVSPHTSTHSLSQHHSPYVPALASHPAQHPGEATFFTAHPSPYSTNSAAGSYASSGMSHSFVNTHRRTTRAFPSLRTVSVPSKAVVSDMTCRAQRRNGNPVSHEPTALSSHLELPDTPV